MPSKHTRTRDISPKGRVGFPAQRSRWGSVVWQNSVCPHPTSALATFPTCQGRWINRHAVDVAPVTFGRTLPGNPGICRSLMTLSHLVPCWTLISRAPLPWSRPSHCRGWLSPLGSGAQVCILRIGALANRTRLVLAHWLTHLTPLLLLVLPQSES